MHTHLIDNKYVRHLTVFATLASVLSLSGCITLDSSPSTMASAQSAQPQVVVTTDDSSWVGFTGQLQNALGKKLEELNRRVVVNNFSHMTHEQKTVDGIGFVFMNFYTTDGKMYRTRVEANNITQEQIQKLKGLKGATLVGPIPIQNRSNEFFFQEFESYQF